jgi:hypothetical protein
VHKKRREREVEIEMYWENKKMYGDKRNVHWKIRVSSILDNKT